MNLIQLANPRILDQPVYEPGKPIEEVARQHGLQPDQICKLASNENPGGASELAKEAARAVLNQVHLYLDGSGHQLIQGLSEYHGLRLQSVCFRQRLQ